MECCRACEDALDLWNQGERHIPRILTAVGMSAAALEKRLRSHGHAGGPLSGLARERR